MTPWLTWLIISLAALVLSALFSGTEIAFVTSDRVRVEIDVKHGGLINSIINRFYSNQEFFISSILVGNNVMLVIYGMGAAALLEPWLNEWLHGNQILVLISQTLISTFVILMVGEFLPKTVFRINPNSSLRVFALPVYFFYILFYPISMFATWLSKMLMRMVGIKGREVRLGLISMGDLNDYLEETIDDMEEKKEVVENEVKIFQNALDFSKTHLRDCMTPRNEIAAVDLNDITTDELSELFTRTGRSKILVYEEDIDNIVGYIHVSELFDRSSDWHLHIKDVVFAPESMLANNMMRRLLREKRSMAIVVDEFGGVAGLVTLEDLVEEIFGDIQDEHDKSRLVMRRTANDTFEISGRCEIANINETFDLDIPEDDEYQTIAGYILSSTGTIPPVDTSLTLGDLTFKILKKSANRLELIEVKRAETAPERQEEESEK